MVEEDYIIPVRGEYFNSRGILTHVEYKLIPKGERPYPQYLGKGRFIHPISEKRIEFFFSVDGLPNGEDPEDKKLRIKKLERKLGSCVSELAERETSRYNSERAEKILRPMRPLTFAKRRKRAQRDGSQRRY